MKKGLLLVVVMLATIAVKAQDIYVGGSLNVWRNSTGNTTSFKVAPEIGYNFNETWALGAELNYSHEYVKQVTANTVTVAPYIRWSYSGFRHWPRWLGSYTCLPPPVHPAANARF